ncbi:MAG: outer membrane beta-barrel protein [Stagnimonas sp.]|nr:outer membrane beta-barrel protein [Stagnimonas sp.]
MLKLRSSAVVTLALWAGSATAGPFVAATPTITSSEYEDLKNAYGYAVSAGYQLDQLPLFVEGEYYDSGKLKAKDSDPQVDNLSLQYDGFQVFAGGSGRLGGESRAWLKGGYYSFDGKLKADSLGGAPFASSDKTSGFSLGVGIDWMFSHWLGARFEIETPFKAKSLPGLSNDEKKQLSIIRLGLVWRPAMGADRRPAAPAVSAYTPPAPTLAAAPTATVAGIFKPGDEALARPGSMLRASPLASAEIVQALTPSPLLKLENNIVNATGSWWFVSSDIERGWLHADELVKP